MQGHLGKDVIEPLFLIALTTVAVDVLAWQKIVCLFPCDVLNVKKHTVFAAEFVIDYSTLAIHASRK